MYPAVLLMYFISVAVSETPLSNTKKDEIDIENEWKNLQNVLKSAANESLGRIKRRNRRKCLKI